MLVLVGSDAYSLAYAYRACGGKLKCKGRNSSYWETVDFEAEHGPYGRSVFLERLWTDMDGNSESMTMDERKVTLSVDVVVSQR